MKSGVNLPCLGHVCSKDSIKIFLPVEAWSYPHKFRTIWTSDGGMSRETVSNAHHWSRTVGVRYARYRGLRQIFRSWSQSLKSDRCFTLSSAYAAALSKSLEKPSAAAWTRGADDGTGDGMNISNINYWLWYQRQVASRRFSFRNMLIIIFLSLYSAIF